MSTLIAGSVYGNGTLNVGKSNGTTTLVFNSDGSTSLLANTTSAALTINQTGTGNALVVEDSANPDSTPFMIDGDGNVGIGDIDPFGKLSVSLATGRVIGSAWDSKTALFGSIGQYTAALGISMDGTNGATLECNAPGVTTYPITYYSASHIFKTGGDNTRMTIDGNGLVTINAGQIKFPATQNASADANTLDDYEEGTFTPEITFGGGNTGITYSYQSATYVKIGSKVTFQLRVTLSSKGSSTGAMLITGLPFANNSLTLAVVNIYADGVTSGVGDTVVNCRIGASGTTCIPMKMVSGSLTQLNDTDIQNTSNISVTGTYLV